MPIDLGACAISDLEVIRNPSVPRLHRIGTVEFGCHLTDTGALIALSGAQAGRMIAFHDRGHGARAWFRLRQAKLGEGGCDVAETF